MKTKIVYEAENGAGAGAPGAAGAATIIPAATGDAVPGGAPGTMPPAANWYDGADADLVGHLQSHGWHTLDPKAAALAAARSHQEAARYVGVPQNELLRLPKADDLAAKNAMWSRLGKPAEAKGYELAAMRLSDGGELSEAFVDSMSAAFHGANLTSEQAKSAMAGVIRFMESQDAADSAQTQAALAVQKDELVKQWGPNFNVNQIVAQRGAQNLGVTPEEVQALEQTVGYARVMEMFRKVGQISGEDRLVTGNNPAGNGVMTRDQAISRRADMIEEVKSGFRKMEDPAFQREMKAVLSIISGENDTGYTA